MIPSHKCARVNRRDEFSAGLMKCSRTHGMDHQSSMANETAVLPCVEFSKSLYYLDRQIKVESNARSYPHRLPIAIRKAEGLYVTDVDGRVFMDCLCGAGTLALGHDTSSRSQRNSKPSRHWLANADTRS